MAGQEKIRVLQIAGGFRANVNGKPISGGVPSFLYNYCTRANPEKFVFDFMSLRNQCFEQYCKDLENIGGTLYCLNLQSNGIKRAVAMVVKLRKFLKQHHYDAVHINMGSFFPVLCCSIAAKLAGVKKVIAHSHSTGIYSKKKRFFANIFAPLLTLFADEYCGCSKLAAENLFSKKVIRTKRYKVIRNAIDIKKYVFNPEVRLKIRKKFNIGDEFVLGHVGRFVDVKNHAFLLEVFAELKKKIPAAKLLLVGDGELKSDIEAKAKNMGFADDVLFAGQQSDVWAYYQAMDAFALPSTVEGLGLVAVEAQVSGLNCFVSSNVPDEVKLSDSCEFIDLGKGAKEYANRILSRMNSERRDMSKLIAKAGYGIDDNVEIFESLYDKAK